MHRPAPPTVLELVVLMMRQRQLIARTAFIVTTLAAVFILVRGHTYTSKASFIPAVPDTPQSSMAGIAAQFGFALPTGGLGQSPDFYAELLQSQSILLQVVSAEYQVPVRTGLPFFRNPETRIGTLDVFFDVDKDTRDEALQETVRRLRKAMSVTTGRQSGTVAVSVTTEWPELSYQIVQNLLTAVEEFNRTQRQSQAAAERRFIEERLKDATRDLREAEARMEAFLRANRSYAGSPQLTFESDRLAREVTLRQRIVTGLTEGYEKARIDEVRNTPLLTFVENARRPALPDRRYLVLKALVALLGGTLLGMIVGFVRETLHSSRRAAQETFLEFDSLRSAIVSEIKRPWRLLLGASG